MGEFIKINMGDLSQKHNYEVLSYGILREDGGMSPFSRYTKLEILNVLDIRMETLEKILETMGMNYTAILYISPDISKPKFVFKLEGKKVDIDTAIDLGFGVLRTQNGPFQGDLFMYDASGFDQDEFFEKDFYLRLGMYMLATGEQIEDEKLKRALKENESRLPILVFTDDNNVLEQVGCFIKEKN